MDDVFDFLDFMMIDKSDDYLNGYADGVEHLLVRMREFVESFEDGPALLRSRIKARSGE